MTRFTLTVLLALVICPTAGAAFQVGIADPGSSAIPHADVTALGLGAERRTVEWRGEATFTGSLNWTPGLRGFLAVSGGSSPLVVPTTDAERSRYCGFVRSILARYPSVHDVIVWNEPNLVPFWGIGSAAYAQLVQACSAPIRTAGARVWAPGISSSTPQGVADFARKIAALGPHLIDGWAQHGYASWKLPEKIAAIRSALGWRVPVMISESGDIGEPISSQMHTAYCAGAIGWLNFKLRDNADWKPTGLEYADGSHKPGYATFANTSRGLRAGYSCSSKPPASAPPPPKPLRRASRARYGKSWICPERPDGTRVWGRGLCELDRIRIR